MFTVLIRSKSPGLRINVVESLPLGSIVVPVHLLVTMCMFMVDLMDQLSHQLDTRTWTWKQLSGTGPMRKGGCGMVAYDSRLVLFGGFRLSYGPTQPGAEFIKKGDGNYGWTNELQIFDLKEGEK